MRAAALVVAGRAHEVDGVSAKYILDGHTPVPADLLTWAAWFEGDGNRAVAATDFGGEAVVSTVFIGLDSGMRDGAPLLFETMVFASEHPSIDQDQRRYATWEEAVAGHTMIVAEIASALGPPTLHTIKE